MMPKSILSSRTVWVLASLGLLIEALIQAGVFDGYARAGQAVAAVGLWLRWITTQPVTARPPRGLLLALLALPLAGCEAMRFYW